MPSETELAVVLSLKDELSSGMRRVSDQMKQGFSGIEKGTKQLQDTTGGLSTSLQGLQKSLGAAAVAMKAFVVGAIVNELKQAAMEAIHFAEGLDRLSSITGIGAEKLQKYQFAMKMANVEVGEFQAALRTLQLQARKAVEGDEDAINSFKKLGIEMKNNAALADDADALFRATSQGLSGLSSSSERASLGNELMGRTFSRLNPLVKDGMGKIDEYGNALERLGGVVDEKTIKSLDTAGDKLALLGTVWTAIKVKALDWLNDAILPVTVGLIELSKIGHSIWTLFKRLILISAEFGTALGNTVVLIIDQVVPAFQALVDLGKAAALVFEGEFDQAADAAASAWEKVKSVFTADRDILAPFKDLPQRIKFQWEETGKEHDAFIEKADSFRKELVEIYGKMDAEASAAASDAAKHVAEALSPAEIEGRGVQKTLELFMEGEEKLSKIHQVTGERLEYLRQRLELLKKTRQSIIDQDMADGEINHTQAIQNLTTVLQSTQQQFDELSEAQKKAKETFEEWLAAIQQDIDFKLTPEQIEALRAAFANSKKEADRLADSIKKANDKAEKFNELVADFQNNSGIQLTTEQVEQLRDAFERSDSEARELLKTFQALAEADPVTGFKLGIQELQKEMISFKDLTIDAFRSIENAFSSAFEKMIEGGGKMRDIMKGFFSDIKKSFIKMLADMAAKRLVQTMVSGIGSLIPGVGAAFGGLGGAGAAAGTAAMGGGGGGGGGAGSVVGALGGATAGAAGLIPMFGGAPAAGSVPAASGMTLTSMGTSGLGAAAMGIAPAGMMVGAGITAQGISEGSPGTSAAGGALTGAMAGMMVGGPIGLVVGGIIGGAAGYFGGKSEEEKQEKEKQRQEEQVAQQQEELKKQKEEAARELQTSLTASFAGGLATPEAAEEVGRIFAGGVTPEDVDAFQAGDFPHLTGRVPNVSLPEFKVPGMSQGTGVAGMMEKGSGGVSVINPTINISATISSGYDVNNLSKDLIDHMSTSASQAAALTV